MNRFIEFYFRYSRLHMGIRLETGEKTLLRIDLHVLSSDLETRIKNDLENGGTET